MAAFNASKIAHCKNDGNSEILHFLYNNQNEWAKGKDLEELNKNLLNVIELKNFNINFDECLKNKEIEDHILSDRINGVKKFQINATPTIIIDNKKFEKSLSFKKRLSAISSISKFVNLPSSAAAIAPRSSETTITIASVSSVSPYAALCLVPISGVIISLSVRGNIHPADSTKVFCRMTAPSCNGLSG